MRILIILKYIPSSTSDRKADAINATIRAHEKAGFKIVLLTSGRIEEENHEIIRVQPKFYQRILIRGLRFLSQNKSTAYRESILVDAVKSYHHKKRIDAVFAYCTANHPGIHAEVIKRHIGIPYVLREHKTQEKLHSFENHPPSYQAALMSANKVFTVSEMQAIIMRKWEILKEITQLPNAIEDSFFSKPQQLITFDNQSQSFYYAGWTRWRTIKRLDLLIHAFAIVRENRSATKLIVAGSIEPEAQKHEITELIKKHKLEDSVILYGVATREEIHSLAYTCHCCVMPSDYETFGLPALEAIAAGKPVIATKCNGPESIITNQKLGRLVERGSVKDLAEAMIDVYDNYKTFDSEHIRKHALDNYSEDALANQLKGIYENIF